MSSQYCPPLTYALSVPFLLLILLKLTDHPYKKEHCMIHWCHIDYLMFLNSSVLVDIGYFKVWLDFASAQVGHTHSQL